MVRPTVLRRAAVVLVLAAACLYSQGCTSTKGTGPSGRPGANDWEDTWEDGIPGTYGESAGGGAGRTVRLGTSEQGRPIKATVFDGSAGCVLILGGIHGDEPSSAAMVKHLVRHLRRNPADAAGKTVVCIPRANPDGLVRGTRGNASGVDLNRNFMTYNFDSGGSGGPSALSEPESRALVTAISRFNPSCIVSVHSDLDCIDPDGGRSSNRLARRMVSVSPLPLKDLDARAGSLGSYGGNTLGLKMITYELSHDSPSRVRFRDHMDALLLAIREG
ncbi:MAG: DUF2817 domain-containing protein [Planctomycetota bacterium]